MLACLDREEGLLIAATDRHRELLDAIRCGDLGTLPERNRELENLASAIRAAAEERAIAHRELAAEVHEPVAKLDALADRLPEPWSSQLRDTRLRLVARSADFQSVQLRSANLIASVRSYFQSVLAVFTDATNTARYGRNGARVNPPNGLAIRSCG